MKFGALPMYEIAPMATSPHWPGQHRVRHSDDLVGEPQALGEREERHIRRRIVEERGEESRRPRRTEQRSSSSSSRRVLADSERGDHGEEDAGERAHATSTSGVR
jgi:hypothetical protein